MTQDQELKDCFAKIAEISKLEPEFGSVVIELVGHLHGTYKDKYEGSKNLIDTKEQLYHSDLGKAINPYQMSRYLQRYVADPKYKKGENKVDLFKICHYALFDAVRQNRIGNARNTDIVD
jgi:hypothetical protein